VDPCSPILHRLARASDLFVIPDTFRALASSGLAAVLALVVRSRGGRPRLSPGAHSCATTLTIFWAADVLSVATLTFKMLHVLVFIAHGRHTWFMST
jgi:hypothetical protein